MVKSKKAPRSVVRTRVTKADDADISNADAKLVGQRVKALRSQQGEKGWTQVQLAEKAGVAQQNITTIETGKFNTSRYLYHVAKALGTTVEDLQSGLHPVSAPTVATPTAPSSPYRAAMPPQVAGYRTNEPSQMIPIIGTAAAGRWIDPAYLDAGPSVPRFDHAVWGQYEQYALRVEGPSMNRRIAHGSIVVCTPYSVARSAPRSGDIVHAVLRRGQVEEWTIKELRMGQGGVIELHPDSDDPRFTTPYRFDAANKTLADDEETTLEIRGLAVSVILTLA